MTAQRIHCLLFGVIFLFFGGVLSYQMIFSRLSRPSSTHTDNSLLRYTLYLLLRLKIRSFSTYICIHASLSISFYLFFCIFFCIRKSFGKVIKNMNEMQKSNELQIQNDEKRKKKQYIDIYMYI